MDELDHRSVTIRSTARCTAFVIGIHNYLRKRPGKATSACTDRGNAMLLMNDWLAHTLRAEIAAK